MQLFQIAGYKFISLQNLTLLKDELMDFCQQNHCKGTILISEEGININLCGPADGIHAFEIKMQQDTRFNDMAFRKSKLTEFSFRRLKVKIKKEIITVRRDELKPQERRAPSITPKELKQWLDEKRDFHLLDTRNAYEYDFGTFANAIHCHTKDFSEFPEKSKSLSTGKPIVMFCTGGIRCEKAALHLLNVGQQEVYQLEGGILNYFQEVGSDYYTGDCFVFDGRIAIDASFQPTGTQQCVICQGPIQTNHQRCLNNQCQES